MKFQGTVIKEQNVTFAIVIVKKSILNDKTKANETINSFQPIFPGLPIVLMAQDAKGTPTYYGRDDISKFLSKTPLQNIPWKEYTI